MVQLKGVNLSGAAFNQANFNSAMVQLKAVQAGAERTLIFEFQFRYGTIKRIKIIMDL